MPLQAQIAQVLLFSWDRINASQRALELSMNQMYLLPYPSFNTWKDYLIRYWHDNYETLPMKIATAGVAAV